jgi:predicted nucleic acid-binding Zn finger protein
MIYYNCWISQQIRKRFVNVQGQTVCRHVKELQYALSRGIYGRMTDKDMIDSLDHLLVCLIKYHITTDLA